MKTRFTAKFPGNRRRRDTPRNISRVGLLLLRGVVMVLAAVILAAVSTVGCIWAERIFNAVDPQSLSRESDTFQRRHPEGIRLTG